MSRLTELELAYDGPIPPSALAALRKPLTPEQRRAKHLADLLLDIKYYAALRDASVGKPEKAASLAWALARLDEAHRKLIEFNEVEVAAAMDRADCWPISFKQAAE